ncbi:MAG: hypothetical protein AAFY25_07290 [Pseudomonadota bacterium]
MTAAIVCYSRSGHSRRVADRLARDLKGEFLELAAPRYAKGVFGYARAGYDSLRQDTARYHAPLPSLSGFERVVLCGPVWTSYPAIPLRAMLQSIVNYPGSVSLFLTSGAPSPATKAFAVASADLGRPLTATACLSNSDENTDREEDIITHFLSDLETQRLLAMSD